MLRTLYRLAAFWTVIGLAGGLFYREFTKAWDVDGGTQLAVLHTHTLVLGTIFLLVVLVLVKVLALASDRRLRWFLGVWNVGLLLTAGGMLVKGMFQVMGSDAATHPALAGVSGLGHILLTVALVLLFLVLGRGLTAIDTASSSTAAGPDVEGVR